MNRLRHVLLLLLISIEAAHAEAILHFGFRVEGDASMAACVFCHNGKLAKDVSMCTDAKMCVIYAKHVVNVFYPPSLPAGRYAPVSELTAKGVRLVNGRITCLTCHSLTSSKQHLLVIEAEEDRICKACHLV